MLQIVAYICLRNIHESLRAKYSVFFAWFGRISLEVSHRTFDVLIFYYSCQVTVLFSTLSHS